jgi:Holliday junction resolvasome RuvABC DNA-binding subunit
MKADAALALKTLGYSRPIARAAVERACSRLDGDCDLEALIRAALQSVG